MRITRRQLRKLIAEQVDQFAPPGPDTDRIIKSDQIMALGDQGDNVGANPDASDVTGAEWYEGQRLSKLIQTLQGILDNSAEDPFVRTFMGDGADIESEASSVFDMRDKDDEYAQEMNITGPTLAIIVEK